MSDTNEISGLSRDYRGHKIEFKPSDLKFHVTGPEFDQFKESYCTFASFDEARSRIDVEVESTLKIKAQNLKLSEIVIQEDGKRVTVEKINRSTGSLSGVVGRYVYPNIQWIKDALIRYQRLLQEVNSLQNLLTPFRITVERNYSRIDADKYPRVVENFLNSVKQKTELAEKSQPAEIVQLNQG